MSSTASYWCNRCTRIVRLTTENDVVCPYCDGEFVEHVDTHVTSSPESPRRLDLRSRRAGWRTREHRSPFNPFIVLRGASGSDSGGGDRRFEVYYDDGTGSGLHPLIPAMSEFLIGPEFHRLLDQLSQIEMNELVQTKHSPASKSAMESMPVIQISDIHVSAELHCAVCKEAFVIGDEAREMPCNHIYHSDCIFRWLNLRNTCPVCRHELSTDLITDSTNSHILEQNEESSSSSTVGLTLYRLPGGGFAVGRLDGRREIPVVHTEMDGGSGDTSGMARRIVGRAFRNVFSFVWRRRSDANSNEESMNRSGSVSGSVLGRMRSRANRGLNLDE